ncbi:MAG TPA: EXLDI protein [Candidatus Saccharimonadales bacterium]|nr:EXLDI protein [Candidatus Saccharimonadales bacterium]
MPNKTIYVSEKDASLFEQAKNIAGEALSSVIVRALSEFVARNQDKKKGMKDVTLQIGLGDAKREQRFVGSWVGDWSGFSDDKVWWLNATIYKTQKDNWAVYLVTVAKASLLTDRKAWKESGDYLINSNKAELFVGANKEELKNDLPKELFITVEGLIEKDTIPVEYLDI